MKKLDKFKNRFITTFGPGLLFACTAIGVSHLMQSTRAGAEFGFALIGFVILANLFKYPFFEFASRYANVTGTSIIDGYEKIGKHILILYLVITVSSMFIITAAVGFVTAGFLENLFGLELEGITTLVILFSVCIVILSIGRFGALNGLIKIIGAVLVISTVIAFVLALLNGPVSTAPDFFAIDFLSSAGIFFVIALMGWMPMPVDISSWHSLWTLERIKQTNFRPHLRETLLDFNLGYVITAILALFFVILGAYIFFDTGQELPNNNALFANKIVSMYTETIGQWSYIIIASSAFSVMFGTIIAVFDGYSRTLDRITYLLFEKNSTKSDSLSRRRHVLFLLVISIGAVIVVSYFGENLKQLVDFATIVSFLIAPVIAVFNFRLVTGRYILDDFKPKLWLKILSILGIIFLTGFAVFFILIHQGIIQIDLFNI